MDSPFWAGDYLPPESATRHFCAIGASGSGKTITLQLLMQSVLPAIAERPDHRALIYDSKQDLLSLLYGMAGKAPIRILNPFDRRSSRWDIARDVTSLTSAQQIAAILVPEEPNSNNRYFTDAARHILTGIMLALIYQTQRQGSSWTFRDVVLASKSKEIMIDLFTHCPYTDDLIVYFEADNRETMSILTTIASRLAAFEPIAGVWDYATSTFSVRDWLNENSILVLGNEEASRYALDAINRALFKRVTELILAQTESARRRTWIILDEVREAGNLEGLGRLATKGRSKGASIVIGFQDIEGLRDAFGDKIANEILGQFGSKAILRLASPETARWASDLSGTYLRSETSHNEGKSETETKHPTLSSGTAVNLQERAAFYTSEFFHLPFPDPKSGLSGIYVTPEGIYRKTFNPFPLLPLRDPLVRDFWARDEEEQYLRRWTPEDKARLFGSLKEM